MNPDIEKLFAKLDRQISVNFFNACVQIIMNLVLNENKNIVNFFKQKKPELNIRDIVDLPLITISGGEVINMYSDADSIVATKDLDTKIVLPGVYSLPYNSLTEILQNIPEIKNEMQLILQKYNRAGKAILPSKLLFLAMKNKMNIEEYFDNRNICNYDSWLKYMNKIGYSNINYIKSNIKNFLDKETNNQDKYIVYNKILESKNNFVKNIFKRFRTYFNKDGYFYTLNNKLISIEYLNILLDPNNSERFMKFKEEIEKVDESFYVKLVDNIVVIPITLMIPKLNKKSRLDKFLNFPFTLRQPINGQDQNGFNTYQDIFFMNKEEHIIKFKELLEDLHAQILEWFNLDQQQEQFILDNFMDHFDLFYNDWGLSSIFNYKFYIVYNISLNDLRINIASEGFVDLWSEYYSQYSDTKAKRFYEYKLPTGDLPCIIEKIDLENTEQGYLKIPSIFWAIKDQTGMLVLALRKERVPPVDGWTENSATFIPANHDPLKYCKKCRSLLKGLHTIINIVKTNVTNNSDNYDEFLKKCKDEIGFDIIECGADGFVSYLFKNNNDYWKRVGYNKNANINIQNTINNSILPIQQTGPLNIDLDQIIGTIQLINDNTVIPNKQPVVQNKRKVQQLVQQLVQQQEKEVKEKLEQVKRQKLQQQRQQVPQQQVPQPFVLTTKNLFGLNT